MSQSGCIVWYTESHKIDCAHILNELPALIGFDCADTVYRLNRAYESPPKDSFYEVDRKNVPAKELPGLYVPGKFLEIEVEHAKIGDRVEQAILSGIPKEIRGQFIPNRPYVYCGPHFLVDDQRDPAVFAHPIWTIGCWGYSTAQKWKEMIRRVFKLPEIVEEQHRLEHLIGNLEHAMYWSI